MIYTGYIYLFSVSKIDWSKVTPIVAVIVSVIALFANRKSSRKNIRLSIQQAIFKTVAEKAKDCNSMWENEPANEKHDKSPHYRVMSELIISTEIIEKSFSLFADNYKSIQQYKDDYYYLFYKQLRTDLRGWIKGTPNIIERINDQYYSEQVTTLQEKLKKHFEPIK